MNPEQDISLRLRPDLNNSAGIDLSADPQAARGKHAAKRNIPGIMREPVKDPQDTVLTEKELILNGRNHAHAAVHLHDFTAKIGINRIALVTTVMQGSPSGIGEAVFPDFQEQFRHISIAEASMNLGRPWNAPADPLTHTEPDPPFDGRGNHFFPFLRHGINGAERTNARQMRMMAMTFFQQRAVPNGNLTVYKGCLR